MSFWKSVVQRLDGSEARSASFLDRILLASLQPHQDDNEALDQIAFVHQTTPEIADYPWEEICSRRAVLEQSDRDLEEILSEIGQSLKKTEHKQLGLTLVTKMLIASDREVSIDFLDLVADELHASKAARSDLLTPWSQVNNGLQQFRRCTFNRPETLLRESLFSAIAHAETDIELSLLIAKLIAVRYVIQSIDEDLEISSLGELVDLPSGDFRVDALLTGQKQNYICRFLAEHEALHPSEIDLIPELIEVLDENSVTVIAYTNHISAKDKFELDQLNEPRLHLIQVFS